MAEIKIEKKKPIWPWILIGLLVLGAIFFIVFATGTDDDFNDDNVTEQTRDTTYQNNQMGDRDAQINNNRTANPGTTGTTTGNEVDRYIDHVGDRSRMGIDHEYTNTALIHLINAVESKARDNNVNIDTDLQEIRRNAEAITRDPKATNHADKIKEAGTKLANTLEKIQQNNYPNLRSDIQEVKTAAGNIETSVLTLEQKEKINTFFDEAADVLRKMS